MRIGKLTFLALMAASLIATSSRTTRAQIHTLTPTDDAELRESDPERLRDGGVGPATGGPVTELAVRTTGIVSIVKFDITAVGLADITGQSDFRIYVQDVSSNPDGVRLYGLNSGFDNHQAGGWDESRVYYRDTGIYLPTDPPSTSSTATIPLSDTICGGTCVGASDYGADPNHPDAAPGIAFELAPYSQNVVNANNASPGSTPMPGYYVSNPTDDVVNYPVDTPARTDVANSGEVSFLGYLNTEGNAADNSYVHFTSLTDGQDDPAAMMDSAQLASNNASLNAWLQSLVMAGETSATFLITAKNLDGSEGPSTGSNKRFSSKDKGVDDGFGGVTNVGFQAPQLVIGVPEPSSIGLASLCLGLLAARRRK